ncbi:hypothetical protein EZV62_025557 [Acer yangbiense]|uniref:DUF674 domain-containing protein n=1 Tax=Acer yangbiense TaxID=1000413 RepID=A0A5C7GZC0_9ROSI|nr:hypothetical protein EZV62_025557 [Acer yangbiense]
MEAPKLQLKLFIDTKANKLILAEAGKDFVDFLFYFISLPISTVVRLLNKKSEVGCLDDLYAAIENLDNVYIQTDMQYLLDPRGAVPCTKVPLLLSDLKAPKVYTCSYIHTQNNYVSYVYGSYCPDCRGSCNSEVTDVVSHVAKCKNKIDTVGFVKRAATFMVMDNLDVKPILSNTSFFTLLKKFGVKDLGEVEERDVEFGPNEVLKLVKASLEGKTVLTNVFLRNKGPEILKEKDEDRT